MSIESSPKLGLETINISAPCGELDLTRACVQSLSIGMRKC